MRQTEETVETTRICYTQVTCDACGNRVNAGHKVDGKWSGGHATYVLSVTREVAGVRGSEKSIDLCEACFRGPVMAALRPLGIQDFIIQ